MWNRTEVAPTHLPKVTMFLRFLYSIISLPVIPNFSLHSSKNHVVAPAILHVHASTERRFPGALVRETGRFMDGTSFHSSLIGSTEIGIR